MMIANSMPWCGFDSRSLFHGLFAANDVQIRAANCRQSNSNHNFVRACPRTLDFFDSKFINAAKNIGAHTSHFFPPFPNPVFQRKMILYVGLNA